MTTRRNFFQWVGGLVAAALAPKLPAQSTAPEWSAANVVGEWDASVSVSDVIDEITNRKFWASGKSIVYVHDYDSGYTYCVTLPEGATINDVSICKNGQWQDCYSYAASAANTVGTALIMVREDAAVRSATFQLPAQGSYNGGGRLKVTSASRR